MSEPTFNPSLQFDLGPHRLIPMLNLVDFPIGIYRNVGYDTSKLLSMESDLNYSTLKYLDPVIRIDRPEADSEGVWHNICGLMLRDNLDQYTNYNLVWQYHVNTSSVTSIQIILRIAKIHYINPLDVTVYATNTIGFGGHGNISNILLSIIGFKTLYNDHTFIAAGIGADVINNTPSHAYVRYATMAVSDLFFTSLGYKDETDIQIDDPNEQDPEGPSGPGGGDGAHSRKTEAVALPDLPALGALDAGMITLYRLTGPEMTSFTSELWTFWSAVKAFFADPLDFVIGCMIVPFTPNSTRQARPKFGADVWNTAFDVISEQFYSISCGTIDIEKYYGSCFDYDPYHKLQIYIPYVGYRDLPVDQIMGKTIELTYHIDCMTGDFVAFVHTPVVGAEGPQLAQIICQFAGTMGVHVPLSRESFDAAVSAGINLLGGAVGMAAGGIAMAAGLDGQELNASQIANQASAATVSAINAGKRNVIRSGSIGASSGMLAKQNPFIISTLPRQSLPENYKDLEGYPSNIYGTVGSFPGYLAVETIKLNVTATSTEKEMIIQMLKGGVYV